MTIPDADVINKPIKWPCWPFLPLKRHKCGVTMPESGLLWDSGKTQYTVFLANMFELPKKVDDFLQLPKVEYPSAESLLADGWEID